MKAEQLYITIAIILISSLFIDKLPIDIIKSIDTYIGRVILFGIVAIVGLFDHISEAILLGTVSGLLINKSHDISIHPDSIQKTNQNIVIKGSSKIKSDMTPKYSDRVIQRLGLIPMESYNLRMENMLSYQIR